MPPSLLLVMNSILVFLQRLKIYCLLMTDISESLLIYDTKKRASPLFTQVMSLMRELLLILIREAMTGNISAKK